MIDVSTFNFQKKFDLQATIVVRSQMNDVNKLSKITKNIKLIQTNELNMVNFGFLNYESILNKLYKQSQTTTLNNENVNSGLYLENRLFFPYIEFLQIPHEIVIENKKTDIMINYSYKINLPYNLEFIYNNDGINEQYVNSIDIEKMFIENQNANEIKTLELKQLFKTFINNSIGLGQFKYTKSIDTQTNKPKLIQSLKTSNDIVKDKLPLIFNHIEDGADGLIYINKINLSIVNDYYELLIYFNCEWIAIKEFIIQHINHQNNVQEWGQIVYSNIAEGDVDDDSIVDTTTHSSIFSNINKKKSLAINFKPPSIEENTILIVTLHFSTYINLSFDKTKDIVLKINLHLRK